MAKLYIYRNLTSKCFSVKLRGKVVSHFTEPLVFSGSFSVSEKGRQRVVKERKKYVHAYVVCNGETASSFSGKKREITYNPFKNDSFVYVDTGEKAEGGLILMEYPKVYILE